MNSQRNSLIEHWLDGCVSNNCMRETLGMFHYDGIDYKKTSVTDGISKENES